MTRSCAADHCRYLYTVKISLTEGAALAVFLILAPYGAFTLPDAGDVGRDQRVRGLRDLPRHRRNRLARAAAR